MSNLVFTQYLKTLKNINKCMKYNDKNNKVAVIVEPRKHEMLEFVIKNVATKLDETWNLHIFTSDPEWCMNLFPDWIIKYTKISCDNLTIQQYSNLLMDKQFWELIKEEHILIFQTDCIFFKSGFDKFLEYDYIGPNYYNPKHVSPLGNGIQGGVSMRRKSAMIDCIKNIDYNIINNYRKNMGSHILDDVIEDVYFTHACEILKKNVATKQINRNFGIEVCYDYNLETHCHHGFNKPYLSMEDAMKLLSNS